MNLQTKERTEVRFSPRRLGHANMFVGDFERSFDFYHRLCGFEVAFGEQGGRKSALMSNGNTHHDIAISQVREDSEPVIGRGGHVQIPKGRGIQPGLNHFGWELEHQKALVDAYHRAQETGLELHRVADPHGVTQHLPVRSRRAPPRDVRRCGQGLVDLLRRPHSAARNDGRVGPRRRALVDRHPLPPQPRDHASRGRYPAPPRASRTRC